MKKILLFLMLVPLVAAGGKSAKDFMNMTPDFREYLVSVESGLINDEEWRSLDVSTTSTAAFSSPTTYYLTFDLVDDQNRRMQWFNGSVSAFTVSTSVAGVFSAALTTDIIDFNAGRGAAGVTLTGSVSIGSTVTVSAPTFTQGVATVSTTASRVLTFSE